MGKRQCMNTFNNVKRTMANMMPPELSGFTRGSSELPNTDKAEENNLKNNFMKMTEALKEEMQTFL